VVLPLNRGLTFDLESNFPSRGLTSALDWTDKHRKQ
jgi:hypothetical protein